MCTNFERSGYAILKAFDTANPKSVKEVYSQLSGTRILLGARVTIDDYVVSLFRGNELKEQEAGRYVLTQRGVRERDRLREIVEQENHAHC